MLLVTEKKTQNQFKGPLMDEETLVYICNEMPPNLKKEGNIVICNNINEPGRHYAK